MHKHFQIFQFFNYRNRKELRELVANINNSGAAAVFDLEDSLLIPFDDARTNALKENAREILSEKVLMLNENSPVTGIRINSVRTPDYRKDLELLSIIKNHHTFNYIFIPKIENALHLKEVVSDFEERGLHGVSFIPIVESKRGYDNLGSIAGFCRLNHIEFAAFGHCDYNKDISAFPFIHPGSSEYVELIKPFVETVESAGMKFVNSPFLELKNNELFEKVHRDTANICKNNFAQVTLSKFQTECVNSFFDNRSKSRYPEPERPKAGQDKACLAKELIAEYESAATVNTGIAISESGRLLSPQEYECAKKLTGPAYKAKPDAEKSFNVCILGGCLPVQEKIRASELYHSILCGYAEREFNFRPEIIIERYDTFAGVPAILKKTFKANGIDCLIFHVRPDPFLINVKFFAKYINDKNKKSHKFNLHVLGFNEPPVMPVNIDSSVKRINIRAAKYIKIFLRNINYAAGFIVGNANAANRVYEKTILNIKEYCNSNAVSLIVVGPPARPRSKMEMYLLKKLGKRMKKSFQGELNFVDAFHKTDNEGNNLFFGDKVHYNQHGHLLFADLISKQFLYLIESKCKPDRR
ncbi:MAG: aldolase/citrate lyase family protein [Ignavibacteria bacterium]